MTMTVAFDTLKFARRLKDAGVSEEQAEAFSEAFRDAQETQLDDLATKGDLRETKLELKSDIRELEARMAGEMNRIMGEIRLNRWMLLLVVAATVLPALKTLFGL